MTGPTRLLLLVLVSAGLVLILATTHASGSDRDCSDFKNQKKAQLFFLRHGGPNSDPDGLDADHDGIACESNPCPCSHRRHLSSTELIAPVRSREVIPALRSSLSEESG
jgi:hypothetical protein